MDARLEEMRAQLAELYKKDWKLLSKHEKQELTRLQFKVARMERDPQRPKMGLQHKLLALSERTDAAKQRTRAFQDKSKQAQARTLGTTPEALHEGEKRVGRTALWAVAPPLGLWRSWKHAQRKRDAKLAQSIAEGARRAGEVEVERAVTRSRAAPGSAS